MKKRACRHRCDTCEVNFESWDRFSVQLTSRGHRMKELATTTQNVQLVSDVFDSSTGLCDSQDYFLFMQEPLCDDDSNSDSEYDDAFGDFGSFSSDSEEESNGDRENVQRPTERGLYFPFPSEIFFLLYSYAHNVSRPKVKLLLYAFNLFIYLYTYKKSW